MAEQQEGGGWLAWGSNMLAAGTKMVTGALGFDELEVHDPNAGSDSKGGSGKGDGHDEDRKALFTQVRQFIGKDVMSLMSMPVWLMEPLSLLQKAGELFEYHDLLAAAAKEEDPHKRLALVSAFAASTYIANQRTHKPFNPILGETYEMELGEGGKGGWYMAEQVSHHPPVGAAHAEGEGWEYDLTSSPKTKFMGNWIDVFPVGRTRITLTTTGETFNIEPPQSRVHNLLVGRTWVDHHGEMRVRNLTSGAECLLEFTPCGWFGAGRYEVKGAVRDAEEKARLAFFGKWVEAFYVAECDDEGEALESAEAVKVWEGVQPLEDDPYYFSAFAHWMNKTESAPRGCALLASDSRARPDLVALAANDLTLAGQQKVALEERQRAERKEREEKGEPWVPRWFEPLEEEASSSNGGDAGEDDLGAEKRVAEKHMTSVWKFTGEYAKRRAAPPAPASDEQPEFCPWQFAS